jgi:hypothetical protein
MQYLTLVPQEGSSKTSKLFEGTCSKPYLESVSLEGFLALELMARCQGDGLLPLLQEAFAALAMARNGDAARQVLVAVHALMVPMHSKSAHHFSISEAEFRKRRREEEHRFFTWLDSVYWDLPLYSIYHGHPAFEGRGLKYGNPLKAVKQWVAAILPKMWQRDRDPLANWIFKFFCDSVDSKRFFKRATNVFLGYASHRTDELLLQSEDVNLFTGAIREVIPNRDKDTILFWLHKVQKKGPWEMRKLLGHAYVNAGGMILAESS